MSEGTLAAPTAVDEHTISLTEFLNEARAWLEANCQPHTEDTSDDIDVQVFRNLSHEREEALIRAEAQWQQAKLAAGYVALDWAVEDGGRGLAAPYTSAFDRLEAEFGAQLSHELVLVTVKLIAPTLRRFARPEQRQVHMRDFLSATQLCCQLFSEPGAGSDLAALATRARRDGDGWVVTGQKVWSSGAQFADWGLLLARTAPEQPKHAGITAFLVPMDAPGVRVRPLRQLSGGSSFCEVFLDDVLLTDELRVGEPGQGWAVAMTTLGFERESSDGSAGIGGSWELVRELALRDGHGGDAVIRQGLAQVYTRTVMNSITAAADAVRRAEGEDLGATGSLRKLQWVRLLAEISDLVAEMLGAELTADSGRRATFAWRDHVLGAVGYSIAGGTDEVQRSIIAERLLGLPAERREDKSIPWNEVPR